MILGMGIDIVKISRIESLFIKWKDRFLNRFFTEREIDHCIARRIPSQHLAIRFAAKEAFLKSLMLGMRAGIPWKDIEIINNSMGMPSIELHNKAKEIGMKNNIKNIILSMSHDGDYGIAQVILEG